MCFVSCVFCVFAPLFVATVSSVYSVPDGGEYSDEGRFRGAAHFLCFAWGVEWSDAEWCDVVRCGVVVRRVA